ncbi:TPA: hypothetical protein ACH3X1_003918 [Trebouxia sp. C0004]
MDHSLEPTKAELIAYEADKSAVPTRTAYCVVQAFPKSPVNEVEVELSEDSEKIKSCKQAEGVEPPLSPDDCFLGEQNAKADPQVQEQLKLRGVTKLDLVACDTWSVHMVTIGGRLVHMWMYYHNSSPKTTSTHILWTLSPYWICILRMSRATQLFGRSGTSEPVSSREKASSCTMLDMI